MEQEKRVQEFRKNDSLEGFLKELNGNLSVAEKMLTVGEEQHYPILFVMGAFRSGTTLMTQWLAATGEVAYPTNLLSRFYGAPILGAKIQRLLTDEKYNFRNEILDFNSPINYRSENGKTRGALAPNEFWYFWRRFLQYDTEVEYIEDEKLLQQENTIVMRNELMGITEVFEKPFVLKGMICNYNIGFLNKLFDKVLFIYMKRNPYTNIESALKARERQLGNCSEWYSFKIPEYPELKKIKNPAKQVAGQIYHINHAIQIGLNQVAEDKKMTIEYEDFCENPEKYYLQIVKKLAEQGCEINPVYKGESQFKITRESIDPEIEKAYKEYLEEIMGSQV